MPYWSMFVQKVIFQTFRHLLFIFLQNNHPFCMSCLQVSEVCTDNGTEIWLALSGTAVRLVLSRYDPQAILYHEEGVISTQWENLCLWRGKSRLFLSS